MLSANFISGSHRHSQVSLENHTLAHLYTSTSFGFQQSVFAKRIASLRYLRHTPFIARFFVLGSHFRFSRPTLGRSKSLTFHSSTAEEEAGGGLSRLALYIPVSLMPLATPRSSFLSKSYPLARKSGGYLPLALGPCHPIIVPLLASPLFLPLIAFRES